MLSKQLLQEGVVKELDGQVHLRAVQALRIPRCGIGLPEMTVQAMKQPSAGAEAVSTTQAEQPVTLAVQHKLTSHTETTADTHPPKQHSIASYTQNQSAGLLRCSQARLTPACRLLQICTSDMRVLKIFHADTHPSLMGIGSIKEGFSVLAMLDRCVTAMVRSHPRPVCAMHRGAGCGHALRTQRVSFASARDANISGCTLRNLSRQSGVA